jgi:ppGpp synthetase/RelA/SpoT-type nucleotidyltranferase
MAWAECQYTRERINKAGRDALRLLNAGFESWDDDQWTEYDELVPILNNWRACHAYPLNILQTNLRRAARRFDRAPLIAQRTKRFISIVNKLDRQPKMKLSQMQDIGGCRAVVKSSAAVRKLDDFYLSESQMKHERATRDDYIAEPRPTGYRGIHLVYRFYSDKKAGKKYNGLKIEKQLRSLYQHAWATAVETVGTFLGQALKSSAGPDEWLRFFALMGTVIASRERAPLVPGTPANRNELLAELDEHAYTLNVVHRLEAYNNALQRFEKDTQGAHYYLLKLDPEAGQLAITGFKEDESAKAQLAYSEVERTLKGKPGTDAVLVAVDSLAALQRAYPNYFADTRVFVELLKQARSGRQERVRQLRLPLSA